MAQEKFEAFIVRRALTHGIQRMTVERASDGRWPGYVWSGGHGFARHEWAKTTAVALIKAERMRVKEIDALMHRIHNLKIMTFSIPEK